MLQTRRALLKHATIVGVTTALTPTISLARARSGEVLYASQDDPDLRSLIMASVDAARHAGASYADARITHVRRRSDGSTGFAERESITAGVRALVNGYWGFASGPVWDRHELVRLAKEAVDLAKVSAAGKGKQTVLAPLPSIPNGAWTMPVKIDPFSLHPAQIRDAAMGLREYARSKPYFYQFLWRFRAIMMDKSFGSSDGAFFSQRTYSSLLGVNYMMQDARGRQGGGMILNEHAGEGFEIFDEEKGRNEIDRLNAAGFSSLPVIPVDVGRYETVFDGSVVAEILGSTIGCASELDRALGFEANAGGTSYLNAPDEMIGAFVVGSPLVSVEGERTEPGGLATVQWDDEGMRTARVPLVEKGILQTFQTNRELASTLAHYRTTGSAPADGLHSSGGAYASEAVYAPLIRTPNLRMAPGDVDQDLDALVSDVEKGVLFRSLDVSMDFQQLNGFGMNLGSCYEIRKGKIINQLMNAGILFRAPEFWKSVTKIGGAGSLRRYPYQSQKGEPAQVAYASVTCPPIVCKDQTIIDYRRKA